MLNRKESARVSNSSSQFYLKARLLQFGYDQKPHVLSIVLQIILMILTKDFSNYKY